MKLKGLGKLLLGIWLIGTGLLPLLRISIPHQGLILSLVAVAAGIIIIVER